MTPYDTGDPKDATDAKDALLNSSTTQTPSRHEAEQAVDVLLRWIGEDPSREGLAGTPSRVVRAHGKSFAVGIKKTLLNCSNAPLKKLRVMMIW